MATKMRSNLRPRHRREARRSRHLLPFRPPEGTLLVMSQRTNDITFYEVSARVYFLVVAEAFGGHCVVVSPQFGSVPLMRLGYGATGLLSAPPKPLRVG